MFRGSSWRVSVSRRELIAKVLLIVGAPGLLLAMPRRSSAQSAGATAPAKPAAAKSKTAASAAATKSSPLPAPPQLISVGPVTDVDPHKAFGSKSAPVIMEVFSDFQCPACKNLFLSTNRQLVVNYMNTGKVSLVHR